MKIFVLIFISFNSLLFGNNFSAEDIRKLEKDCNLKKAYACSILGIVYNEGAGVKKDYYKANKYFIKACALNSAVDCMIVGASYEESIGAKQNYSKAKEYYDKACALKDNRGCRKSTQLKK